jgi:maltose O-acetyltransferase
MIIARLAVYIIRRFEKLEVRYFLKKMNTGKNVRIRSPFFAKSPHNVFLGDNVSINKGCTFLAHDYIRIGENSLIGPNVTIITVNHDYRKSGIEAHRNRLFKPVTIGKNAWIGANALLLPGVTIGDDAVVGGGSVVTTSIGAGDMVAGNPARFIKRRFPEASDSQT